MEVKCETAIQWQDTVGSEKQCLDRFVEGLRDILVDSVADLTKDDTLEEANEDVADICKEAAPDANVNLPGIEFYSELRHVDLGNGSAIDHLGM